MTRLRVSAAPAIGRWVSASTTLPVTGAASRTE